MGNGGHHIFRLVFMIVIMKLIYCLTSTWNLRVCFMFFFIDFSLIDTLAFRCSFVHDRIEKLNVCVIRTDSITKELNLYGMHIHNWSIMVGRGE